jgi:hypothetical protein
MSARGLRPHLESGRASAFLQGHPGDLPEAKMSPKNEGAAQRKTCCQSRLKGEDCE